MTKATQLRETLEKINTQHGQKLHLVNIGGNKFGLYKGDRAKNAGMRVTKGNIDYLTGFIEGLYLFYKY